MRGCVAADSRGKFPAARPNLSDQSQEGKPASSGSCPKITALPHPNRPKKSITATALFVLLVCNFPFAARAESLLDAGSVDYTILTPDGHITLGHGRYLIHHLKDTILLEGESRYTTGEYDIETDMLSPGQPGALPKLEKYDHLFYTPQGVLTRASHADMTTAFASCVDAPAHVEQSGTMDFPSDTWAGASVLIPIQDFLQNGGEGKLSMNVFNCTSKPGIYPVTVAVDSSPSQWPYSPGGAVQVDVKPHFGWFDMFIAPFVPKLNAWFDPGKGWGFEGVAIARYYKGPQILMVKADAPNSEGLKVLIPTPTPAPAGPAQR